MRHNKKFNHLSRTASHRDAMLANMAISLIMHKRINTTVAKAKALRKYVEPLINRSKQDTTASRRLVFSYLQNKYAVTELFQIISERLQNVPVAIRASLRLVSVRVTMQPLVSLNWLTLTRTWLRLRRRPSVPVVPERVLQPRLLQWRLRLQRLQRLLLKHRQNNKILNCNNMIRRPVREDEAPFFVISGMDIVQQGTLLADKGMLKLC